MKVDDPEYDYNFVVDMNVSPLQKVYNIGDTISITFEILDNTLHDSKSQTDIKIGNLKDESIYFHLYFDVPYIELGLNVEPKFALTTNQPDIINSFDFSEIRTTISCERLDNFQFEIKCVPLKSGIFTMFQFVNSHSHLVEFNTAGNCNDNLSDFQSGNISYKFDVPDNNPELLEELYIPCNASLIDGIEQRTEEKDFFWIKVE